MAELQIAERQLRVFLILIDLERLCDLRQGDRDRASGCDKTPAIPRSR